MMMKTADETKRGLEYLRTTDVAERLERFKMGLPYAFTEEIAADALELIQQLEAQAPRWISVEERLPERGITKCSACVKCGDGLKRVVCASYNAELKLWTGWHGEKIGNVITHWMPLPEPPEA